MNIVYFFIFYFYFLLYNIVLVLPYIDMNLPQVYMSSQSWTPLPPTSLYHLSGSSQCTSPKHPVFCIEPRLAICFLDDSIRFIFNVQVNIISSRIWEWDLVSIQFVAFIMVVVLLLLSSFSHVLLCATPWTAAHQAPRSLGFSRQEHWSGLPFPSPMHESEKWKWSRSVVSDP